MKRVFGYGSLVNRATHGYPVAEPAAARGWRRAWRRTSLRPVSYLTVHACAGCEIQGLVAEVPGADWEALDTRERAYERRLAADLAPAQQDVAIYALPDGAHWAPRPENPILLSYLDVVLQGYLREFGAAGVAQFVATTDGWDAPILDDRGAPRYPRAQLLSHDEAGLVNEWLARLGARVLQDDAERVAPRAC